MGAVRKINSFFGAYLSWIVLAVAGVAFVWPSTLAWAGKYIAPLLQLIMFGMGLTLNASSFVAVFKQPWQVLLVTILQFLWMPIAGYFIAKGFGFPPEIAVGFILLGSVPGGTSSNIMAYLANGNVPLSVTATSISTLLAPIMTPFLVVMYAGAIIDVPFWPMFVSIIKIVIVPIVLAVLLNHFLPRQVEPLKEFSPTVSTIGLLLIMGSIAALSRENIINSGGLLLAAALLHNMSGYVMTYFVCRLFGTEVASRRTMQIEVAMQNSALSVSLAMAHFSPAAAIAGAAASVIQTFTGSLFADFCRKRDAAAEAKRANAEAELAPVEG